jgi:late competence protein required for DNA uptake (superfamily II DNA/RNA helicase)
MHDSINSNSFVENIVINENHPNKDEQGVECNRCSREIPLSKHSIKLIKNYKREAILMQKRILMRFLKSLKSVPKGL